MNDSENAFLCRFYEHLEFLFLALIIDQIKHYWFMLLLDLISCFV